MTPNIKTINREERCRASPTEYKRIKIEKSKKSFVGPLIF